MMPLAKYLTLLRKQYRFSRLQWAEASGVSRITLWRWEKRTTLPRETELIASLVALGVTPAEQKQAHKLWSEAKGHTVEQIILKSDLPFTHRGHLLRVTRLHRGWTQEEAAAIARVPRATLAKWEQMTTWPATDRLHELCYAYKLNERELLLLTAGWGDESETSQTLVELSVEVQKLEDLFYLDDEMDCLILAGKLSRVALESPEARNLLARNYVTYAHTLLNTCRYREAQTYLRYAAQLADPSDLHLTIRLGLTQSYAMRISHLFQQNITQEKSACNALQLLQPVMPLVDRTTPRNRTRIYGDLALCLAEIGRHDEALKLNSHALKIGRTVEAEWITLLRTYERQKILLTSGRHAEVIPSIPSSFSKNIQSVFFESIFLMNRGKALTQLGDRAQGTNDLLSAREIAITSHMPGVILQIDIELRKGEGG